MPETLRQFARPLNAYGDFIRVVFTRDGKQLTRFTVQYEAYIDDFYRPVVRYDVAHGFAHRDELDWNGTTIAKTPMPSEVDYNTAMTEALRDLTTHWERYRADFLGRRP